MPGWPGWLGYWDGQAATPQGFSLRVCLRGQVTRPPKYEQNCPMHIFQERGPRSFSRILRNRTISKASQIFKELGHKKLYKNHVETKFSLFTMT